MTMQPIYVELTCILPGAQIHADDKGNEYIPGRYGRVEAINSTEGDGFAAVVFENPTASRLKRVEKIKGEVAWHTKDTNGRTVELAVKLEFGKSRKLLHIVKLLMRDGSMFEPLKRKT